MQIDLQRYLGLWFEVAHYPNWFESGAYATAQYSLQPDGTVQVINTSYDRHNRPIATAIGIAQQRSGDTLGVRFAPAPVEAEYKVEWVDEAYSFAIVGNSAKSQLWILSRQPTVSVAAVGVLLSLCAQLGYDTRKLLVNRPLVS